MVAEQAATDPWHRQAVDTRFLDDAQSLERTTFGPTTDPWPVWKPKPGGSRRRCQWNPPCACPTKGEANQTIACKDDHEEETLHSDDETMKKVTINEASTLMNTIAGLKASSE